MAALGIGATVLAVPRALSGIVAVPQGAEAGISRTVAATSSTKPTTAKMPVWTAPAGTSPSRTHDTVPPAAITGLRLVANDDATISLAWDPGTDNVAVKAYVVKGDGFPSFQTTDTKATVVWPHRTSSVSVLVSAVDTSGNQGQWRSLVVTPPVAPAGTAAPGTPTTAPVTTPTVTADPPSSTSSTGTASVSSTPTDTASTGSASTGASPVQSAAVQSPAGSTVPAGSASV